MFSKKRNTNKLLSRGSNSTRRKRMISNNKKKIIWRHRNFAFCGEEATN